MSPVFAWIAAASYFVAATLFLLGLQRMASPVTARSGIRWAGAGMVIATVATFLLPALGNLALIAGALVIGVSAAWVSGKKVAITDMPQMVALYNGMGGGSAAAIGLVLYFIGALSAHVRVRDRGIGGAVSFLVLAGAALIVGLGYHNQW